MNSLGTCILAALLFPLQSFSQDCRIDSFTVGPSQPGDTVEHFIGVNRVFSHTKPSQRVSFRFNTETNVLYVVESGPLEATSTLSRPEWYQWGTFDVVYRSIGQPWVAVSPPLQGTGGYIVFQQGAIWPVAGYRVSVVR